MILVGYTRDASFGISNRSIKPKVKVIFCYKIEFMLDKRAKDEINILLREWDGTDSYDVISEEGKTPSSTETGGWIFKKNDLKHKKIHHEMISTLDFKT